MFAIGRARAQTDGSSAIRNCMFWLWIVFFLRAVSGRASWHNVPLNPPYECTYLPNGVQMGRTVSAGCMNVINDKQTDRPRYGKCVRIGEVAFAARAISLKKARRVYKSDFFFVSCSCHFHPTFEDAYMILFLVFLENAHNFDGVQFVVHCTAFCNAEPEQMEAVEIGL